MYNEERLGGYLKRSSWLNQETLRVLGFVFMFTRYARVWLRGEREVVCLVEPGDTSRFGFCFMFTRYARVWLRLGVGFLSYKKRACKEVVRKW